MAKKKTSSKVEVEKAVDEILSELNIEDCFAPTEDLAISTGEEVEKAVEEWSPDWSDYVMGMLEKDELYEGCPTVDGLRRVATYLDPMVDFQLVVHYATPEAAGVTGILSFGGKTIHGSAECNPNNTDDPYSKYPLATAESRAEGRALRRALKLRKVVTAEEKSKKADLTIPASVEDRTEGSIIEQQINFINRMCKKWDWDVPSAIKLAVGDHESIEELSYAEGQQVNMALDKWSKEPPEDMATYDENWRSNFSKEV